MNTIDNTMNAEYTPESDKNLMSWGRVVKFKGEYDEEVLYHVRFNPELYNITFKSGYDQDDYFYDMDSDIIKVIVKTKKELVRLGIFTKKLDGYNEFNEVAQYQDYPRYGSGKHFIFKDETIAHMFANLILSYMKGIKWVTQTTKYKKNII